MNHRSFRFSMFFPTNPSRLKFRDLSFCMANINIVVLCYRQGAESVQNENAHADNGKRWHTRENRIQWVIMNIFFPHDLTLFFLFFYQHTKIICDRQPRAIAKNQSAPLVLAAHVPRIAISGLANRPPSFQRVRTSVHESFHAERLQKIVSQTIFFKFTFYQK